MRHPPAAGAEVAGADRGRVDRTLRYQIDVAATILELLGARVPSNWDGAGFAEDFKQGREAGREFLVVSQGAWTAQRAVRFGDYICIRTYHDGYHALPEVMLFDLDAIRMRLATSRRSGRNSQRGRSRCSKTGMAAR